MHCVELPLVMTSTRAPNPGDDRERTLTAWASSDKVADRCLAAWEADLPVGLMRRLLFDQDDQVVLALLSNHAVPRELLDEARAMPLSPEQREQLAEHCNAPFDLAEALPVWKHTAASIASYCAGRGLDGGVRDRVLHLWAEADQNNALTLAEVVEGAR